MTKTADSRLHDFARIELCNLILGEKLGSGCYRDVCLHALDHSLVVKIEMEKGSFSNIMEWEFWLHNQYDPKMVKFLAPCHHISPSGLVLIQDRTFPIVSHKKLPKRIPSLLGDHSVDNWGHLGIPGGPVVCHDYGNLNLSRNQRRPSKLKTVQFYGTE